MGSRRLVGWTLALVCASAALAFYPLQESDLFWHLSLAAARTPTVAAARLA
jgi:hypothetical protein